MKVRLIIAARASAGAMLVAVTVAACTGGSSSSAPSIFTPQPATQSPTPQASGPVKTPTVGHSTATPKATSTARASAKGTSKPRPSHKATATAAPTDSATRTASPKATPTRHRATPAPTYTPVPAASQYPNGAPQAGGGGTAGFQDGLLLEIGGAAVLAGLGSLSYRRRLRRKHRADTPDRSGDTPARTGIR